MHTTKRFISGQRLRRVSRSSDMAQLLSMSKSEILLPIIIFGGNHSFLKSHKKY